VRVCEQCGNANDPQARFCVNPACGAYLGWDEPPDGTQWPAPPRDRKPAERLVEPERQEYGIRLELVPDQESTVEPGGELRLEATVRNVGTLVESLAPRVHAPVGWISVEPPTLSVFPGGQESVAVLVTPPPVPAAPAGVVPFHLVVQSTLHPRVAAAVDGTAFVGAVDQLSAELQPATATGKGRAAARLVLHNGGNRPVQVAVTADEREQAVRTAVRPALLELGPGRDAEAAVALRPRRRLWFGQPARHPY